MLIATLFVVLVSSTGYALLRALGLASRPRLLGLAAPAGLAGLSVTATWVGAFVWHPPVAGALVVACGLAGIGWMGVDRGRLWRAASSFVGQHRLAAVLLGVAVLVPIVSMGLAYWGVGAPLSPHDGAFHVETSDAVRRGTPLSSWYPPGLAALFGAILEVVPWLDSAAGSFELGLGLTLLLPIAVFGVGVSTWRNAVAASVGAVCVSVTHLVAYFPQAWSGWPQLLGMLLVLGLWITAVEYVDRPCASLVLLAAVLVGSMILVHGTEVYTSAVVLGVVGLVNWPRLPWRRLGRDLPLASGLALVCAAPYLPELLHWAGSGGAYAVGLEDGSALGSGAGSARAAELLGLLTLDALGVDLPIRMILIGLGVVWALRTRTATVVIIVAGLFAGFAVASSLYSGMPVVRQVYAATYPWSVPYRLVTLASVPLALLAGGGGAWLAVGWGRVLGRVRSAAARRRLSRSGRLLVLTWLGLSTSLVVVVLSGAGGTPGSFTADDAAAMEWLRAHAAPGAVVANDTFADAGIWAPYKADVPILFYRSSSDPATVDARELVLRDIMRLDQDPAARAACALDVRYVYHGAQMSSWQARELPSLEELRSLPFLNERFSRGAAVVFSVGLNCGRDRAPGERDS